jgi:hypothetical protein
MKLINKLINDLIYWRMERLRMNYEDLSHAKQLKLQEYYDNCLSEYWEEQVVSEGAVHYDDVDGISEMAWEWYLEH